ncbi:MAG: DUF2183 domain-containing protein [Azoarcus sp.]|nr:DUF2183 domain-containing protein [Azoarcus sp.]
MRGRMRRMAGWAIGLWACCALAAPLDDEDRVLFFPDIAVSEEAGVATVHVKAWVYEQENRRFMRWILARYLGIDLDRRTPEERALFHERTRYFRVDSERGVEIAVRLDAEVLPLPKTDAAGRASGAFAVRAPSPGLRDAAARIAFTLDAPPGHPLAGQTGYAWFAPPEGVSVVSDIDDTIKISHVRERAVLMENTFLKPFAAVPGMAAWYRELARTSPGAAFHYLSASPMQLYPALQAFLDGEGFPAGSMHLRESTSWRTLIAGKETSIAHKTGALERLFASYPKRRFILIGDSGENDPEIYAGMARRYPERVEAIHIRDVTDEDRDAPRYRETFRGLPPALWTIRNGDPE